MRTPFRIFFVLLMSVLLALVSTAPGRIADANGSQGDVKTHEGASEPTPIESNDTKVCTFHLHGTGFESNEQVDYWVDQQPPTGTANVIAKQRVTTDANGEFVTQVYDSLPNGHYKLYWEMADETVKHKVFKVECAGLDEGTLAVEKYSDLDGDGIKDDGEGALEGWTFTVKKGGHDVGTLTTDATGTDRIVLPADTYSVVETPKTGYIQTQPTNGSAAAVDVTAGQTATATFGNYQILALKLTSMCSDDPSETREWRVRNPNPMDIPFTWEVYPNLQRGEGVAAKNADVFFTTTTVEGPNTTKLYWSGGQTVKASGGEQCELPTTGTLIVFKFNDLNNNGVRDDGEPGLGGRGFTVTHALGVTAIASTQAVTNPLTTGADGYATVDLAAGTYLVTEDMPLPAFWSNTKPGGATPGYKVGLANGQTVTLTFGNHFAPPPTPDVGTLRVTKYNDLDADGTRDASEPGLEGWAFVVRMNGSVVGTLHTGSGGIAAMSLGAGTYTVTETTKQGWTSVDPGGATPTKTVSIALGQTTDALFGNAQIILPPTSQTQLVILKYEDKNANGRRDDGDGGLAGFTFIVRDAAGNIVGTVVSGPNGVATITNLALGSYTITEQGRDGWTNTDPGGTAVRPIALTGTSLSASVSFGNAQIRLPSTSTDDTGTLGIYAFLALILASGVAIWPITRRTIHFD